MKIFAKTLMLLIIATFITSCGNKGSMSFDDKEKLTKDDSQYLINHKKMPASPDLGEDAFIANYDYPVELSIYENGKFYYNLDNLGDGTGDWKEVDGIMQLSAEHELFNLGMTINMTFYVYRGEGEKNYKLSFRDRHGLKKFKAKVLNR